MRRLTRPALAGREVRNLHDKQQEVDAGADARRRWDAARKTKTMGRIATVLKMMTGPRERCMFCEDSRGTDIDHFRPLAGFRESTFEWPNLILLCSGCNRAKGDRFDTDSAGRPLLVDPTVEDPWDLLVYVTETGEITARVDPVRRARDERGSHMSDPSVLPLNIEPITDGRRRTQRRLFRAVRRFLDVYDADPQALVELRDDLRDNDDFGLVEWFFRRDGGDEEPVRTLRRRADWSEIESALFR